VRANPGGEIDPKDVIGRDSLIDELWTILDSQSVVIVAERRMGKSSIVKKMRSEPRFGAILLYRDVEGLRTPLEFVERVYQDLEEHFSVLKQGAGLVRRMFEKAAGAEFGTVKFPENLAKNWKSILESALADLSTQLDGKLAMASLPSSFGMKCRSCCKRLRGRSVPRQQWICSTRSGH
jgi:hypothetical protein